MRIGVIETNVPRWRDPSLIRKAYQGAYPIQRVREHVGPRLDVQALRHAGDGPPPEQIPERVVLPLVDRPMTSDGEPPRPGTAESGGKSRRAGPRLADNVLSTGR